MANYCAAGDTGQTDASEDDGVPGVAGLGRHPAGADRRWSVVLLLSETSYAVSH